MSSYCSPVKNTRKGNGCFSKDSLEKLIESWNKINSNNKIIYNKTDSNKKLWEYLNNKLTGICDKDQDWCWAGAIENMTNDKDVKQTVKKVANKDLRPEKPLEWEKNPRTWLSNFDIDKVMRQYESNKQNKYKFLGVYPIDFNSKDKFGKCLFKEFCNIDINDYIKKGIKYIGLITNLDKHDEPGSHWTSTFIILDPKLKSYGAYYYDSTAKKIPSYVLTFLKDVKKQIEDIYPINSNKKFFLKYNNKQHQKKNTECGVFSILFQIRWLNYLKKNKETVFEDIIADKDLNDDQMNELRNVLFRPNIKSILKKKDDAKTI